MSYLAMAIGRNKWRYTIRCLLRRRKRANLNCSNQAARSALIVKKADVKRVGRGFPVVIQRWALAWPLNSMPLKLIAICRLWTVAIAIKRRLQFDQTVRNNSSKSPAHADLRFIIKLRHADLPSAIFQAPRVHYTLPERVIVIS